MLALTPWQGHTVETPTHPEHAAPSCIKLTWDPRSQLGHWDMATGAMTAPQ